MALFRFSQCAYELAGGESLNAVRKWERRERLENNIVREVIPRIERQGWLGVVAFVSIDK